MTQPTSGFTVFFFANPGSGVFFYVEVSHEIR